MGGAETPVLTEEGAEVNYYNDNDKKACAWLRELIAAGELPPGDVDERSITEIKADDLAKYDQCHFFAEFRHSA